jgi:predicted transcriptional regulator
MLYFKRESYHRITVDAPFIIFTPMDQRYGMKQRGVFSITTLILGALQQKPLTKTKLMQQLMFNYSRIGSYCNFLIQRGLIEYDHTNNSYLITSKGTEILKLSRELASYLEPIHKMIEDYSFYIEDRRPEGYFISNNNNKIRLAKHPVR